MQTTLAAGALLLAALPWPAFRGDGSSQTSNKDLPLTWSATENVTWSLDLPGYGQSSPVVAGELAIVTSVSGDEKEHIHVVAVNVRTGKIAWQRDFAGTQQIKDSNYVSKAAPTPAVDADRVYALFESGDVFALDHSGKTVWQRSLVKEFGRIEGAHGLGASVALTEQAVIVLMAHEGPGYLLAVDKQTGKNLWKTDRPAKTSWSSPIVSGAKGQQTIAISSAGTVSAYSAADGKQLWEVDGLDGNNVPSPTIAGDLMVVGSSKPGSNLAIRDGKVAWRAEGVTCSFASPLIHNGRAYFVARGGVAYCCDLANGKELWTERLSASVLGLARGRGRPHLFLCHRRCDHRALVWRGSQTTGSEFPWRYRQSLRSGGLRPRIPDPRGQAPGVCEMTGQAVPADNS